MTIKQDFNLEEKKKLEHMLSLSYMVPKYLGSRKAKQKLIYICIPILWLFSIFYLWEKIYPVLFILLPVSCWGTSWIIRYRTKGIKFEKRVQLIVYEGLKNEFNVTINDKEKIINYKGTPCSFNDIKCAIYYDNFIFIILKEDFIIIKVNNKDEKNYIKDLLTISEITQEEKSGPFNIYKYIIPQKRKSVSDINIK